LAAINTKDNCETPTGPTSPEALLNILIARAPMIGFGLGVFSAAARVVDLFFITPEMGGGALGPSKRTFITISKIFLIACGGGGTSLTSFSHV